MYIEVRSETRNQRNKRMLHDIDNELESVKKQKYPLWERAGNRYRRIQKYKIIKKLSSKYAVGDLCEAIGAFYGWERKGSKVDDYEQDVRTRYELVCTYARENPKHGSEWLAAKIYIDKKIRINHKVIERFLYGESRKDKESEKLPTDMNSKELSTDSDSKSRQNVQKMYPYIDRRKLKVVSPLRYVAADVTGLKIYGECKYLYLFVDTWSRMILGYALSNTSNDGKALRQATDMFIDKKMEYMDIETVLNTDNGAVFYSEKFNRILDHYGIIHSMSHIATPTDNGCVESVNRWVKEELTSGMFLQNSERLIEELDDYIRYFNKERPAYSLGYLTPEQYIMKYSM